MGFLDSTPFIFVKDVGCLNWFLNGGVKISLLEVSPKEWVLWARG